MIEHGVYYKNTLIIFNILDSVGFSPRGQTYIEQLLWDWVTGFAVNYSIKKLV
jgi:hypothetical protein